jgi:hypothetical protein
MQKTPFKACLSFLVAIFRTKSHSTLIIFIHDALKPENFCSHEHVYLYYHKQRWSCIGLENCKSGIREAISNSASSALTSRETRGLTSALMAKSGKFSHPLATSVNCTHLFAHSALPYKFSFCSLNTYTQRARA